MENSQNSSKISLKDIHSRLHPGQRNTAERLQWSEAGRHALTRIETNYRQTPISQQTFVDFADNHIPDIIFS